jgi:hypothetical protein
VKSHIMSHFYAPITSSRTVTGKRFWTRFIGFNSVFIKGWAQ